MRALATLVIGLWAGAAMAEDLRIGYLSADFRSHPMGGLIHGLFAEHDRSRCRPFGYIARCQLRRRVASIT